jgi:hypothetical protein
MDYNVWGVIKNEVYGTRPASMVQLRDAIELAFANFSVDTSFAICHAVRDRFIRCLEQNGGHFQQFY